MSNAPVSPDDFKAALGSWAAGVTVVTTRLDDLVYGITVSSFSSLSMDPLLVLVCLADSNRLPRMIEQSGRFAVSILAAGQDDVSATFARSGREAGNDLGAESLVMQTGAPVIAGSIAALDCELEQAVPGGDHTIMIGRVVAATADPSKMPLIYYRRGYRDLVMD
ncbi:MAG: flavin reductase family protein [Thermomicrobiales bacterium]|nr:flavin reductase family protein [Thermomicrobiales bacterium]